MLCNDYYGAFFVYEINFVFLQFKKNPVRTTYKLIKVHKQIAIKMLPESKKCNVFRLVHKASA